MSYKQCPFCGEKNIQRGYGTGVDLMTQDNRPWIGGTELELREMTGTEEELLTNQRLIRSGEAINQVLRNCFVRLGEKTDPDLSEVMNLLSGDRLFALVRLRQISLEAEGSSPSPATRF